MTILDLPLAAPAWPSGARRAAAAPRAQRLKRWLDVVGAMTALVLLSPLMLACAVAVWCEGGPGVIFRQERVGLHGRPFRMLKFRSLAPADEHESSTRWTIGGDRRVGRVGAWLRRCSLDELPQLVNVLRGDMSLVGPRPERPHFVALFSQAHQDYLLRHRVPGGITGLAQVRGLRGDTCIAERVRLDNHYIESWSLWLDVRILARTLHGSVRKAGG